MGYLKIPALRVALIAVLGRAVKETEAESLLLGLRKTTFGGQKKVRMYPGGLIFGKNSLEHMGPSISGR